MTTRPRMTRLEAYAQHGSCSYGEISPERLRDILRGDAPKKGEHSSIRQALLETPAIGLHSNPAAELASEVGLTLAQIEARCVELTGETMGSSIPGIVTQMIEVGLATRYANDLDSLNRARQAVRDELLMKSWVLPPYTSEADFQ